MFQLQYVVICDIQEGQNHCHCDRQAQAADTDRDRQTGQTQTNTDRRIHTDPHHRDTVTEQTETKTRHNTHSEKRGLRPVGRQEGVHKPRWHETYRRGSAAAGKPAQVCSHIQVPVHTHMHASVKSFGAIEFPSRKPGLTCMCNKR